MAIVIFYLRSATKYVANGRRIMDILDEFLIVAAEIMQKKDKPLPFPEKWCIMIRRRN